MVSDHHHDCCISRFGPLQLQMSRRQDVGEVGTDSNYWGWMGLDDFVEAFFGETKMHFVELRLGFDTRNNGKNIKTVK